MRDRHVLLLVDRDSVAIALGVGVDRDAAVKDLRDGDQHERLGRRAVERHGVAELVPRGVLGHVEAQVDRAPMRVGAQPLDGAHANLTRREAAALDALELSRHGDEHRVAAVRQLAAQEAAPRLDVLNVAVELGVLAAVGLLDLLLLEVALLAQPMRQALLARDGDRRVELQGLEPVLEAERAVRGRALPVDLELLFALRSLQVGDSRPQRRLLELRADDAAAAAREADGAAAVVVEVATVRGAAFRSTRGEPHGLQQHAHQQHDENRAGHEAK